jgi:hypothetical protein
MVMGDTLHLQILARVPSQLQNFSSQVLQDSSRVACRCSTNTAIRPEPFASADNGYSQQRTVI